MHPLLKIGTRKSPLALKQVELVVMALSAAMPEFTDASKVEIVPIITSGDQFLDLPLTDIGGKGLFTKEIDEALLNGRIDIAIHSTKDMQTHIPDGLEFAAVLPREDARDVLLSHSLNTLHTLPRSARVGTSSLRRTLFLKHKRPDLFISPVRGNIQTRIRKMEEGEYDAIILALAGLKRMGIHPIPGTIMEFDEMLPAPAQGIIAIQCRADDQKTKALLANINHEPSMLAAKIERKLLSLLDGNCKTPIAAYAEIKGKEVHLRAMLGNEKTGEVARAETHASIVDIFSAVDEVAKKLRENL